MKTALYAGTFDPVTRGHLDLVFRAGKIFDRVIVAIARNPSKAMLFTAEERLGFLRNNIPNDGRFEVVQFDGLLVEFARKNNVDTLIRGLRAVSDFEYEFQMTQMNRDLDRDIETLFLMPGREYFFTSSSLIKQVAVFSDRINKFVPDDVAEALEKRLRKNPAE